MAWCQGVQHPVLQGDTLQALAGLQGIARAPVQALAILDQLKNSRFRGWEIWVTPITWGSRTAHAIIIHRLHQIFQLGATPALR